MKKIIAMMLVVVMLSGSIINASALDLLLPARGDADGNGRITSADARLILRASVGLHTPFILLKHLYDTDSDGKITSHDARLALRIAVGLESFTQAEETKEDTIKKFTNNVSESELQKLMTEICAIGSRSVLYPSKNAAAQSYIINKLEEYGVKAKKQDFYYSNLATANIVATLQKNTEKDILLICTHYDCPDNCAGAIDNASGVAALLHLVKLIKDNNIDFNREIRIAFFSAEEMGYYGAYHYISQLSGSERNRLTVLNIDMAGNSLLGGGKILAVSTEPVTGAYPWRQAQSNTVSNALDKAKALLGNIGEEQYLSPVAAGRHDIVPFRKSGIPAVTISWREVRKEAAYGSDYNLAPPSQIHTGIDTLANFNMTSLYNTTRLILAAILLDFAA